LYLRALGHSGPAELLDFSFAERDPASAASVRVARLSLPCDDGTSLWFTGSIGLVGPTSLIKTDHLHLFIGMYDSEAHSVAELPAAAYHYNLAVDQLDYGHTLPLGRASPLRSKGYSSLLILDAGIYRHFAEPPTRIGDVSITIFSVLPM